MILCGNCIPTILSTRNTLVCALLRASGEAPSPSGLLPFHEFSQQLLLQRFKQLATVLTCATLTNWPSSSHGAYAWVKCAEGTDCRELFLKVNLYTLSGQEFGATSQCKLKHRVEVYLLY